MRVLDLSQGPAGAYAALLLGELGADVIKVEPPGGDPARTNGYTGSYEASFDFLNRGKRSVTLDTATRSGRAGLRSLAETADAAIEDGGTEPLPQRRLSYRTLKRANPAVVLTILSPFGADGQWALGQYGNADPGNDGPHPFGVCADCPRAGLGRVDGCLIARNGPTHSALRAALLRRIESRRNGRGTQSFCRYRKARLEHGGSLAVSRTLPRKRRCFLSVTSKRANFTRQLWRWSQNIVLHFFITPAAQMTSCAAQSNHCLRLTIKSEITSRLLRLKWQPDCSPTTRFHR